MKEPNEEIIDNLKSWFGIGAIGSGGGGASDVVFDFNGPVTVSECAEIGHCGIKISSAEKTVFKNPASVAADEQFDFYAEAVKQNQMKPEQTATTGVRNAMHFAGLAIRSGVLDDLNFRLLDQSVAIMQSVLENLERQQDQDLSPELGYHLANAVNELYACQKLCSGKLQQSVFDLSAAVERIRNEVQS